MKLFSGSPFTEIVTSPVGTSLDLANKITKTKASKIMVNIATPRIMLCICYSLFMGAYPTVEHQRKT